VTLQLAGKIVLLEEQLDEKRQGQEAEFRELEAAQQEELDKTKQGIQQREDELLKRTSEFKARADQAENEVIRL
jgi:DNA-binding protein H-NS